jgi:hypothetical protein
MRQVKLYTLKEDVVVVVSDHINFHNYPDRPIHVRCSDEFIIDAPIQIKQAAVERYVEFGRNAQEKGHLFAFDPEIRKLLGINEKQLKDELLEVKKQRDLFERHNARLKKGNDELFHCIEVQYNQLCVFTTMAFWKRLVFLFTGKVN